MPSQQKSSSTRRGSSKKKAVFDQAFLNAVSESDTEELTSALDSTPRQNLVSPDLSEMTLTSYTSAIRNTESTNLLTADDGAPVSLQPAPVNSTVPEDVLASPASVPSAVITSSCPTSDTNTPSTDQNLRPTPVQVASSCHSVSPDGNSTTFSTAGLGHAPHLFEPDDPRASSLNNPTAPIHVDTLRESTIAIHISVPCARQHNLLDVGTSTTLLTDVFDFDTLAFAPLWYEILQDMIIDVITASAFLPAEQFAILDDFRNSATPFGSSRLFDVRGKPLDTHLHHRSDKYNVNIFINMSGTMIMETCVTSDSAFRDVVADLHADAALKAHATSIGADGITDNLPSSTPTLPAVDESNTVTDMSVMSLLESIIGSIIMVLWAFLWYFIRSGYLYFVRGGYLYIRNSLHGFLVSIHQSMLHTIHRYKSPDRPSSTTPTTTAARIQKTTTRKRTIPTTVHIKPHTASPFSPIRTIENTAHLDTRTIGFDCKCASDFIDFNGYACTSIFSSFHGTIGLHNSCCSSVCYGSGGTGHSPVSGHTTPCLTDTSDFPRRPGHANLGFQQSS
jgi:hypothetical protein